MTKRPLLSLFVVFVLVALAAVVAVSLNVLLLGRASAGKDPIGRLSPRANFPAAPHWTVRPTHSRSEDRGLDD